MPPNDSETGLAEMEEDPTISSIESAPPLPAIPRLANGNSDMLINEVKGESDEEQLIHVPFRYGGKYLRAEFPGKQPRSYNDDSISEDDHEGLNEEEVEEEEEEEEHDGVVAHSELMRGLPSSEESEVEENCDGNDVDSGDSNADNDENLSYDGSESAECEDDDSSDSSAVDFQNYSRCDTQGYFVPQFVILSQRRLQQYCLFLYFSQWHSDISYRCSFRGITFSSQ